MPATRRKSLPSKQDTNASAPPQVERRKLQDRRHIDRVLRESEQRLRAALEASLDAIFLLESVRNRQGRIVDFCFVEANQRALERMGQGRAEFLGSRLCATFPFVTKEGHFARWVGVVETGAPAEGEFFFNTPGHEPRWLHYQMLKLGDGVVLSSRDISERKKAEALLREVPERVYAATEAERRRVARELHDGVSQLLSAACLRLHSLASLAGKSELGAAVRQIGGLVQKARDEVRRISQGLRPSEFDDLGLEPALRSLIAEFADRTRIKVSLRLPPHRLTIPPENQLVLYRLTQEALHNIERHAHATTAAIELRQAKKQTVLRITDNGRGFTPTHQRRGKDGHGLFNMRERVALAGGKFALKTSPGKGTVITVHLPTTGSVEGRSTTLP